MRQVKEELGEFDYGLDEEVFPTEKEQGLSKHQTDAWLDEFGISDDE
jgi:hypothetical protein